MEIETLNINPPILKGKLTRKLSNFTFDLPATIENMKHSHSWVKGELISMILLNRPDKQILLTAMHERTEVNSFQSKDSITFQIIEGKLMFHSLKESVILKKGQLLTLNEKVEYSLIILEETVILLTISNGALKMAENKIRPGS
jgi:hypothetical protein